MYGIFQMELNTLHADFVEHVSTTKEHQSR